MAQAAPRCAGAPTRAARRKDCCSRPVSRILFRHPPIPFGSKNDEDDHSSSPGIADGIQQPTRKPQAGRPGTLPYLVLLRVGFCVPRLLPAARCALTAPFHPCHAGARGARDSRRYVFCSTFRRVAPPGNYPAHCPVEFGLSSPAGASSCPRTRRLPMAAVIRSTATLYYRTRPSVARTASRRFPARSDTARAFCTDCCAACRSPRPSSRCSSRSPGAC